MLPNSGKVALFILLLGFVPHTAGAQTLAGSFDALQRFLKAGDTIRVTDAGGERVQGRIKNVSASSLTLLVADGERDFASPAVISIHRRRRDSLVNGAVLGAAVGAGGVILALTSYASAEGGHWPEEVLFGQAALFGAIGAAVGTGVDALVKQQQLLYSASATSSSRIRVAPLLANHTRGVRVSIGF